MHKKDINHQECSTKEFQRTAMPYWLIQQTLGHVGKMITQSCFIVTTTSNS